MLYFSQYDIFSQLLHNWLYNNVYSISSTYTYGIVYNYITQYTDFAVCICFLYTMWHFFTITAQFTLQQCLQHILNIYIRYCLQLHYLVNCHCYYICYTFHNMIFFHNYCTIDSTTMSTAYPQHIHTVLFTITLPSILTLLFVYASFTQCDIFSQSLPNSLYNNVYSISSTYTCGTVYNYTIQYAGFSVYICFPFHNVNIFPQLLYNCLFYYVYSEATLDTYSTVYNYSPQYTFCAVYICCPFHNVIFFHNYWTFDFTTMSTAYPQHIHIVLFATTPHRILALLFIYDFVFTMWYFSTMTAQFTLQQCLQHILNIYIRYCLQLHYPVYWLCCLYMLPLHNVTFFHNYCTIDSTTMSTAYPQHIHIVLFTTTLHSILALLFIYASFTQCDIFSQLLHNWLYNNVYSISSTYTYGIVYNYTLQYTDCCLYMLPLHNVTFFHNYCTIDSTTMSTAYLQHIHIVLFQLLSTVYWLCCLYMLPLHNVTFFHNYCTIDSTTMSTAYP